MRILKFVFVIFLILLIAAAALWGVLHYLVWPKPEIPGLVPGAPLAYIAASNLDETLSAVENSELVNRVARSPLWKNLTSSSQWKQIEKQKRDWERKANLKIYPEAIMQLVNKDALLAFYGEQDHPGFLLISEVNVLTRINITSGATKRALAAEYDFTTEKYKDVELMTLGESGLKFSYCFIGRVGLLSMGKSLLRKAIDLHQGRGQGLVAVPGYKKSVAGLPKSGVSLHLNVAKIREMPDLFQALPLDINGRTEKWLSYLTSIAKPIDTCVGVGFSRNGSLRFDVRMFHSSLSPREGDDTSTRFGVIPVVPANCLFFSLYESLDADIPFEMLKAFVNLNPDAELPALRNGMAAAVLEPNVKELQMLPPVMVFLRVKDRANAEAALETLKGSVSIGRRRLEFTEIEYENIPICYARVPIGMGMSIDVGYTLIGDDLLVIATDTSALKAAVDVFLGKRQSLTKNENYANVLAPIVRGSDGRIFMNIEPAAMITKQAARLYSWRAKIAEEHEVEQMSTMLYENAFILETWNYMGTAFKSDGDMTNVKLILSNND